MFWSKLKSEFVGVGIDPSFARTGLAMGYLEEEGWTIKFDGKCVKREEKNWLGIYNAAHTQAISVRDWVKENLPEQEVHVNIFMETPLVVGQWAGGLCMLSGFLYYSLVRQKWNVVPHHPSKIRSLLGSKTLSKKKESLEVAKEILRTMWQNKKLGKVYFRGNEIKRNSIPKITHDEAEAFILLAYMFKFSVPEYLPQEKWQVEEL